MAPARIVVVSKPLEQFPAQLDPAADDPESRPFGFASTSRAASTSRR